MAHEPTPPTPKTTTLWPGRGRAVLKTTPAPVGTAQPRRAAYRIDRPLGMSVSRFSLMTECVAKVVIAPAFTDRPFQPYAVPGTSAPAPLIHDRMTASPGLTF